MTLFGWFISRPLWFRIIILAPITISAIEWLVMPFKINNWYNRYKDTLKLLEAILEACKSKREEINSNNQIISILLGMIRGKKNGKEDTEG